MSDETWGLRIRNGFQNLTVDLSQNVYVEKLPSHEEVRMYTNYVYSQTVFVALRLYTFASRSATFLSTLFGNLYSAVYETFNDKEYMFFGDSYYPYSCNNYMHSFMVAKLGTPTVEWLYRENEKIFISRSAIHSNEKSNHIPYLSATLIYEDTFMYDISEFVNSVRWLGETMPSANLLVSAWSISSGIVIERSEKTTLVVINTDGDEVKIPLRNDT